MQKYITYKIVVALLLFATLPTYAIDNTKFKSLSVNDGLSQSSVFAITQDLHGNIWMGTQDGLNRWDGYGFSVYVADSKDETSLNDDSISSLFTASDGTLWIGTSVGLSCFSFAHDRFFNFTPSNGEVMQVSDILEISGGNLLLATDIGLVHFNKKEGALKLNTNLSAVAIRDLCLLGDDVIVGTTSGLYKYSTTNDTVIRILPELIKCDISDVVYKNNSFWISTYGDGLYKYSGELEVEKHYNRDNTDNLKSNYIHDLEFVDDNCLYVGTYKGLSILSCEDNSFKSYPKNDKSLLGHNSIRSIFVDNQNGIWLGSYYGGVSYYNPLANKFNILQFSKLSSSSADNTVGCLAKDPTTGNLWIGTNDEGILYYDIKKDKYTNYPGTYDDTSIKNDGSQNVKCILFDKSGNPFFGKHAGGLNYLNRHTGKIENFSINDNSPINNSCYSLLEGDNDNELWVGTLSGLFSFDKSTKRFSRHKIVDYEPKLASLQIMVLKRDSKGRIWIGTNGGIFVVRPDQSKVRAYSNINILGAENELKDISTLSIMEDSRHNIWIGTRKGLLFFNEHSNTFKRYTMHDGLPNNVVASIVEDGQYRLWISTNRGLTCFDVYQNKFRNYRKEDGIANNQFNPSSSSKDKSGRLYFGGLGGITYFTPHKLSDNPYLSVVKIGGVKIFNEDVKGVEGVTIERDSVGGIYNMTFPSELNLFSLSFGSSNPMAGNRIQYSYTLDGFDTQWYLTSRRSVSYSNLPPDTYTFRVKASNNDGLWGDEHTVMTIRILPMWWQTSVAKTIFILLFLSLIAVVIWFLTSKMRMQLMLDMERKDKLRIEELGEEKVRFYINLSHELRTPLTLILSPLQEIGKHCVADKYVQTRLKYIYRSSTKLLYIVNQMLDYRKTELGMFKLKIALQDVDKVVGDVFTLFEKIAQNRDMDYILNSELHGEKLPVDRTFIEMILTNLLSNAFKFTPEGGGVVKLSLHHINERIIISVRDNGIGIAADKQNDVFDRFYQIDESRSGTGIGLSIVKRLVEHHHGTITLNSEQGKFTEVIISLPDNINCYSEELRYAGEVDGASAIMQDKSPLYMSEAYVVDDTTQINDEDMKETLLVADKSNEICRYLVDHFKHKYNVHAVSDGQKALDMLKTVSPDVVIADRALPTIDGLKLCQMIKQNIRTCHIPVIIVAAKDGVEDQITGIKAGADDYVSKPFSITLLQAKISNLLKSKYRLQHYYSDNSEIEPDKITSNNIDGEFLKRAIDIIEKNMSNEEFSSNDFAKALYMSRSNLHLKMKSITGESSTKFIRKMRFNYACKLITEQRYSISEISSMVGFNTPSYFATSFKKHVGCLPTEYIRSGKMANQNDE